MITALFRHIYLLLTLRHPMTGFPRRAGVLFFGIVALAAVVAGVRWESQSIAVGMFIFVLALAAYSPRLGIAYALISIGIDLVAIPCGGGDLFKYWEGIATGAAALALARSEA